MGKNNKEKSLIDAVNSEKSKEMQRAILFFVIFISIAILAYVLKGDFYNLFIISVVGFIVYIILFIINEKVANITLIILFLELIFGLIIMNNGDPGWGALGVILIGGGIMLSTFIIGLIMAIFIKE